LLFSLVFLPLFTGQTAKNKVDFTFTLSHIIHTATHSPWYIDPCKYFICSV